MPSSQIKFGTSEAYPTKSRTNMVFAPNPLSLSVPEPAFESWLRDSGYLEVLDQRTTELHRLSATSTKPSDSPAIISGSPNGVYFLSELFSRIWTLISLLTFNPFSKLAASDFSGDTASWTVVFFGSLDSYSFPSSASQARLRVYENLKRFARNYATLALLFFACSLYQLPIALLGLILCLALWDVFKRSGDRWGLDRYPLAKKSLISIAQCMTAVILFISNVQFAVFYAIGVSYAMMIVHASFRKLTPGNQPTVRGGHRR